MVAVTAVPGPETSSSGGPAGRVVVITGTDTEIGKTVTTAAIAAQLVAEGQSVVIYKPAQTGVGPSTVSAVSLPSWPVDPAAGDAAWAAAMAGCHCAPDGVRLSEPLAPVMAARRAGLDLPPVATHVATISALAADFDTVLVEGAGGLLVGLAAGDATVVDVIEALPEAAVVVVARPSLGTLNHTWLTTRELDRLARRAGIVIGSWPSKESSHWEHELAAENRAELSRVTRWPVLGALPAGLGGCPPDRFRAEITLDLAPLDLR